MTKNRILATVLFVLMLFTMISQFSAIHANGVETISVSYGLGKDGVEGIDKKVDGKTGVDGVATKVLKEYKTAIAGISGAVSLTFLIFFLINLAKLGSTAGNPQARQGALMGIVWCGLACAGIGAVGIFFGFFYGQKIMSS